LCPVFLASLFSSLYSRYLSFSIYEYLVLIRREREREGERETERGVERDRERGRERGRDRERGGETV